MAAPAVRKNTISERFVMVYLLSDDPRPGQA